FSEGAGRRPQRHHAGVGALHAAAGSVDVWLRDCHNENLKTAGLMLDKIDWSQVTAHAAMFEKVARKVRSGQMPPAGRPRPDTAMVDAFVTALETVLDKAPTNPGRVAAHRLNRLEYVN